MITLTQGKQLGPGDLSILIRDSNGQLIDPFQITYSIFAADKNGLPVTLMAGPNSAPKRADVGAYYVPMTVPTVWKGQFLLIWYLIQYVPSPNQANNANQSNQIQMEFQVTGVDPITTGFEAPSVIIAQAPVVKQFYAPAIMYVREQLSDENPDKNYHFRPPTPGKEVAGFTTRVGFIWTDVTILRMLDIAIAKLNTWNPKTVENFTLDSIPADWGKAAAIEAAAMCLGKEAARWAADQFGYSLNGISLDLNKADLYRSLGDSLHQQFVEWAPLITAVRPASRGVRQQRWLLG